MEAILADEREDPSFGGILDDCLEEALFGDSPMRSLLRFEEAGFPLDTRVQVVFIAFRGARAKMGISALKSLIHIILTPISAKHAPETMAFIEVL